MNTGVGPGCLLIVQGIAQIGQPLPQQADLAEGGRRGGKSWGKDGTRRTGLGQEQGQ